VPPVLVPPLDFPGFFFENSYVLDTDLTLYSSGIKILFRFPFVLAASAIAAGRSI